VTESETESESDPEVPSSAPTITKRGALPILFTNLQSLTINELSVVPHPNFKQKAPVEAVDSVTESESEPEVDLNPVSHLPSF